MGLCDTCKQALRDVSQGLILKAIGERRLCFVELKGAGETVLHRKRSIHAGIQEILTSDIGQHQCA